MLRSALEGEQPVLFSDFEPPAFCVFCGQERPAELLATWMCSKCKSKPLYALIWAIEMPGNRQERSDPANSG